MVAPQVADESQQPEAATDAPDTPETADEDLPNANDVPQSEAVVDDSDIDSGLFSGVEDSAADAPADEPERDPSEFVDESVLPGGDEGESGPDAPSLGDSEVASAINEGAARMAVVGLEDEEKEELEAEFEEIFEAFRLGYFGGEVADEYLMVDGEDVDPIWGFATSMMACAVFAVYMRPDSDEQLEKIADAVGGIGGDEGGVSLD